MPSILVLTTEPPPLPGLATTGAGLRAWGIANGLRSAGFDSVTLAFAADSVRGTGADTEVLPWVRPVERAALDEFVRDTRPDAIVFQHWGMMRDLREDPGCPIAVDLAGPHLLERRLWGSKDPAADRREKLAALSRADFVVCSGQFQRCYFVPFLVDAGFDARSAELCPVIPFSLSPELPEPLPDSRCRAGRSACCGAATASRRGRTRRGRSNAPSAWSPSTRTRGSSSSEARTLRWM